MIIKAIIVIALSVAVFLTLVKGFEGMEQTECQKWEQQKEKYPGWFAADWQKAQCQIYRIEL